MIIPPIANEFITMLKITSLAAIISLQELLTYTQQLDLDHLPVRGVLRRGRGLLPRHRQRVHGRAGVLERRFLLDVASADGGMEVRRGDA